MATGQALLRNLFQREPVTGMGMASRPLRALLWGPTPGPERIFYHNIWFKGHNNPRYAALLPRLSRLDPYLVRCSDLRLVRGMQFRALRASRQLRNSVVFGAAARRYRSALVTDVEQIDYFDGPVVADVDDPLFSAEEARLLSRPHVRAYVVTAGWAGRRFQDMGVRTPFVVIPQGVSLDALDPSRVGDVGAARRPGGLVIGYIAAWLLSSTDRSGDNPLYNVDHLLDLWEEIHHRLPTACLWLVGQPSPSVQERCSSRDDIVLLGRLTPLDALAHVANFDIALYPRRVDHVPFAVKVAEYMGLGVPTVSYELDVTRMLVEHGAGVQVRTPREFVAAVERLATDGAHRAAMADTARTAGRRFDFEVLGECYRRDVLDRFLPAGEPTRRSMDA
jgi:glycosyltransferase involved in cell wall biosynthesis